MADPAVSTPSSPSPSTAGFVFQAGEIYGGSRSAWDYGPLGIGAQGEHQAPVVADIVHGRDDIVGLDSSVILPEAGVGGIRSRRVFTDPLVECLHCHKRFRADHLLEDVRGEEGPRARERPRRRRRARTAARAASRPSPRLLGLLKTYLGPVDDESGLHYLRPETAQGIFVNFANVLRPRA